MRRTALSGDRGVSLVLALLVVTAIALVTVALLGQSFTNTAVTITARKVAVTQYSADAAAQYAANQVRLSDLSTGLCSSNTSVTSEDLPNFYPLGLTTVAQKAHIDCAPDPNNGVAPGDPNAASCPPRPAVCPNASPGTALLTLDSHPSDVGIYVNVNTTPGVKIRGGVFSNSAIKVAGGSLQNSWCPVPAATEDCTKTSPKTYVISRGPARPPAASSCSGTITFRQAGGAAQCNYTITNDSRGADPGVARTGYTPAAAFDTPPAPTALATSQSCSTLTSCTTDTVTPTGANAGRISSSCSGPAKFQKVFPGLFSGSYGANFLNSLTGCQGGSRDGIVWFTPGTYYFDLPAGSPWNLPQKTVVVGGTLASGYDAASGSGPNGWPASGGWADSCVAPGATGASTTSGVEFVAGGATSININNSSGDGSHFTICASNSADGPPIALYGLKTGIGSGAMTVSASALVTPSGTGTTTGALIQSANSPKTTANIVGMTYTPNSVIDLSLNNVSSKVFYWGVVTYAIEFLSTGSADLSSNLVDVQDGWPSPYVPMNRFFLNVYTCAVSAATCPATGASPDVTQVLQVGTDLANNPLPSGNILVLGWSDKR